MLQHNEAMDTTFCLLSCLFALLLVCWFLVFASACTHMEQGRLELGHNLPGVGKKGKDASIWLSHAAVFSRFRSLAFPFSYVLLNGLY